MKTVEISRTVDEWIAEEELPVRAGLREIKPAFAVLFEEDEELSGEELELENEAYWDFIRWCMSRDHQVLISIPKPDYDRDFYLPIETDDSVSYTFGSADFMRLLPEFNAYEYRLMKIYERVTDLAQTYSCLLNEEGRMNIKGRFVRIVDDNFRDQARELIKQYNKSKYSLTKHWLSERIYDLNSKIMKCKDIWDKHSCERDQGHAGA